MVGIHGEKLSFLRQSVCTIKSMGRNIQRRMRKQWAMVYSPMNRLDEKPRVNSAYTVFSFISPSLYSASGLGYALKGLPRSLLHLCVQK